MKTEQEHPARSPERINHLGESALRWATSSSIQLSGKQDFASLCRLKNVILGLRRDWGSALPHGVEEETLVKRLQLAEKEIEGILKRRIDCTVQEGDGHRVLDYSLLLNQKENQIVELEKKVQNLEARLRRTSAREQALEERIAVLAEEAARKEDLIALKHQAALAEVAHSTLLSDAVERLRRNLNMHRHRLGEAERLLFEGVTLPEGPAVGIKAELLSEGSVAARSRSLQQLPQVSRNRARLVQLFREFERLSSQGEGPRDQEVERLLEGFLSSMPASRLYRNSRSFLEAEAQAEVLRRLRDNFAVAAGVFADLTAQLRAEGIQVPAQTDRLWQILRNEGVESIRAPSGQIFVETTGGRVVQVPVQDARTKHLVHLLARQLRGLTEKYPKIREQMDSGLIELLSEEVLQVVEADQFDRLVQIVKVQPELVKVDHIYAASSEKQRRKEFHLRVLLKALMEQLQGLRVRTGAVLDLDEGVIGMIRAQVLDCVSVDDILKVFRVGQKIVEVEKVVQKVVERVVEVPKVITIEKIVEKIVEVEKIKEVEKIVHVPIEKPTVVDRQVEKLVPFEKRVETIVEVPTVVEKIVELRREVPRVIEVEVIKEKVVEVEVPVEVERVVNHIQTELQTVELIQEKVVTVERIVERIVEVPVFVEKIVERVVEVPRIVEVEKIVEKIVKVVEYRNAKQVENHIEIKYEVVDRIVEKLVPVIQIKQRIKEVPQEVQVIKTLTNVVTEIKEVEVIREKLVIQEVIKEVEVVRERIVEVIREVPQEVIRRVEVPIVREVAVIRELIVQKPVVLRVETVHIKEVILREPLVVRQPVIVEVEKVVNVFVEVPKTVKYIEERVVQVPTVIDRIKEVHVIVEKIIQKMVEVPRVVEVEKIVEKIVVVPRIIEKVVEVPQIVEKVVEKEVIRERIVEVEVKVQVPVFQEVIREVEKIRNVYIQTERVVDRVVERTVEVPRVEEVLVTKEFRVEVPVPTVEERTVELQVERIVPLAYEVVRTVQVERTMVVPFEVPVPVELVVQKVVTREQVVERMIPQPQVLQKIVPVVQYVPQLVQIEKFVERILIEKEIREVQRIIPYINEVIREVPTIIEKIVPVEKQIDNIVTVERVIEKVIEKTVTLPQIHEIERIREKLVEVPKLIEIERIVPQIIRVNQYIHKIAEKLVEIPTLIETLKEVVREQEKVVVAHETNTELVQVQRLVEKIVYVDRLKQVVRNVNYIEKVLQIVDRLQQVPVSVAITQERILEVPFILQKIVEKIMIMPQIVQVLKYVHEVCEQEDPGVAVDVEFGQHEARFRDLSRNLQRQLDLLLRDLRPLRSDPATQARAQTIETFLNELRAFVLTPRVVKVVEERIVENRVPVDRIVKMGGQQDQRAQLSMSILVEHLIREVQRLKERSGLALELQPQIQLIFFSQAGQGVVLEGDLGRKLEAYAQHVRRQFEGMGSWSEGQQLLLTSFLQERFLIAEFVQQAEFQLEAARMLSQEQAQELTLCRHQLEAYSVIFSRVETALKSPQPGEVVAGLLGEFKQQQPSGRLEEAVLPGDLLLEQRASSLLREKEAQIEHLREALRRQQQQRPGTNAQQQETLVSVLRSQVEGLKGQLGASSVSTTGLLDAQKEQISHLEERNFALEAEISQLRSENYNLGAEISLLGGSGHSISFRRDPAASVLQIQAQQTQSLLIKPESDTTGRKPSTPQQSESLDSSGRYSSYRQPQSQFNQTLAYSSYEPSRQEPQRPAQATPNNNYQTSEFQSGQSAQRLQNPQTLQTAQRWQEQSGIRSFGVEEGQTRAEEQGSAITQLANQTADTFPQRPYYAQGTKPTETIQSAASGLTSQQGIYGAASQSGVIGASSQSGLYGAASQSGVMGGISQSGVMGGISQSGVMGGISQSGAYGTGMQTGTYGTGSQVGAYRAGSQSGVYGAGSQSGAYGVGSQQGGFGTGSQSGVYGVGSQQGGFGTGSQSGVYGAGTGGLQGLFASRGTEGSRQEAEGSVRPATYYSGIQGPSAQGSVPRTPIEGYKFGTPSGVKMTQSIIRQDESLSQLSAESPQQPSKAETPRAAYQYYSRPVRKEQEKKKQ